MTFSAAALRTVLEAHTPTAATGLVVAVSGGLDSACLLTAVAQLLGHRAENGAAGALTPLPLPVRAIHVDHGLQPDAGKFRAACEALCGRLAIPLTVIAVAVESRGVSLEAAARDARYQGLARQLGVGECLLTAHHALDQAETLLLQLLRGAGLKGMSAMPLCKPFGSGWHLRPLLDVAKRDLLQFAAQAGIAAVSDPMNDDPRFDRAYLRARLWPLIEERWPGAAGAVARTARHVADAQELLDESAALTVEKLRDGQSLSVTGLRALPPAAQLNALRFWIGASAARTLPPTARLTEALRQAVDAEEGQLPAIVWDEHALRRYRQRLFLSPANPPKIDETLQWTPAAAARLDLGQDLGSLCWAPQLGGLDPARLPETLTVRRRRGGESLKPSRRGRTQSVQHLCQSLGVLPWMRDALPLVYAGEALIAVGDLWLDARWCVPADAPGVGCVWEDAPLLV